MSTQSESRKLAIGLTVLAALGRLMPHYPNMTPVGGSALFAGSRVSGFLAYLLPLAVMAATDPLVGGYTWGSVAVYACFMINVLIGRTLVKSVTPIRVGSTAFLCSAQFFLITNFAVWLTGGITHSPYHQPGFAGLLATYSLGLPFWGRTLAGDLLFSGALFSIYEVARRMAPAHKSATV